jgi:hypothetical protein
MPQERKLSIKLVRPMIEASLPGISMRLIYDLASISGLVSTGFDHAFCR